MDTHHCSQKSRRNSVVRFLAKKLNMRARRWSEGIPEEEVAAIARETGLGEAVVEQHYRRFLRAHPTGAMAPAGLRAMLRESLPGADTAALADHLWRIYDTNMDGGVDFREFMLVLCVMRSGSAEDNLRQIFRLFDINSDGRVERGELERVVEELNKLGEGAVGDEFVQQAFTEMDSDMDGGVTQEEFIQACLQHRAAATNLALRVVDIFVSK